MSEAVKDRKIVENVYWTGIYNPQTNQSLNSYLLVDEKVTLIDSGAISTADIVLKNIESIIDPLKIENIFLTHGCVDHIGGLTKIIAKAPNAKVIGHPIIETMLRLYGLSAPFEAIKEGGQIKIGEMNLWILPALFADAWGTLWAFEEKNKILFSADTYCNRPKEWSLFAKDDITVDLLDFHELKFFSNTLNDKEKLIQGAEVIKKLKPEIIASGHGLMIKKDIEKYMNTMLDKL